MPSRRLFALDALYPAGLRELQKPPPELWVRGEIPTLPGVAVVGTRAPTEAARRFSFELGSALAKAGYAVWSGGAAGIDRAAHLGAVRARGKTVLCAGGGLDHPYPAGSERLYDVVAERGALIAIRADDEAPRPWTFLERNSVLAALTIATIVVECGLKSGARSTSAAARRLGRPVFIALQPPWSPRSHAQAVQEEVRLGAHAFSSLDEVFALLGRTVRRAQPIPPEHRLLIEALSNGPKHPDELCAALGRNAADVQASLLLLQLAGLVEDASGGLYRRSE